MRRRVMRRGMKRRFSVKYGPKNVSVATSMLHRAFAPSPHDNRTSSAEIITEKAAQQSASCMKRMRRLERR